MTRVIFMGTPDFSVPSLVALANGGYDIVAVVTQPDRPRGRGRKLDLTPVKQAAVARGIPVIQPRSLRDPDAVAPLVALQPDVIVVAAFGQILRPDVLNLPPRGCINVHSSLLPRWRGAAPVQAAILAGDQVTGSTIIRMDEGMDTGPILAQAALTIDPVDTGETLTARLSQQGAELLTETLPRWLAGEISPQPQDQTLATLCRLLRKEQGVIDWTHAARTISLAVRAFNPWPAATTTWNGVSLKILRATAEPELVLDQPPGVVVATDGRVVVATGAGVLRLEHVQLAGRSAMSINDFLRGQPGLLGSKLGAA